MSNEILTKQDGQVLTITITRPDNGNGMTDAMVVEFTGIIREAPKTSRIIVVRGAGKDFCIGRAGMGARPAVPPPNRGTPYRRFACSGHRAAPAPSDKKTAGLRRSQRA